ncbi:RagB/SusD family nutrient uptake outer membrane protein [Pedobacter nyackensis]|uniref:SusD family protein n=1 Tax=Pedobacter nyackensis TaxID=475255 RepID=A0A1W2EDS9_9SPHI|nr:RagB/SusD family nutrient uptake outer membrane protein [Pedobacter nyackensis]SMD07476.1 SusD family protein [Pedobacter nyackensis]
MKLQQSLMIIMGLILFAGCKKYLSEEPKKQASIKTVDQLEALVDNATDFSNIASQTAAYSTDDTEIPKALYQNNSTAFTIDNLQYYVNSVDGVVAAATDALWSGEFKKIFTANLILENIDQVTGDDVRRQRVKADAYFIRAYSYWVLANYYCAPYSAANLNALGLPLKKTVNYTESLKRATLQETYDFILSDIAEAQKVTNDDVESLRPWRVSKKAIAAFLSRVYLFRGEYDQSLAQAEIALTTATAKLVDYNTLVPGIPVSYANPAATLKYVEQNDWAASKFLYWSEFYYTRYAYTGAQWFVPSNGLLALYDTQNDLRYKSFMIPNGGRRFSVVTPSAFRYTVFNDGRYIPEGPSFGEVLLNKAEVLARKGDASGAMNTVNILRQKRMSTYTALTAIDKDDAIKKVLEERRREMPFALRWYDIRRFSVNDYPADNVTVVRDFFEVNLTGVNMNAPKTYTLSANRLLVPINGVEMDASKGQIAQNPY